MNELQPINFKQISFLSKETSKEEAEREARSYTESIVKPYLKYLNWQNNTLKTDEPFFWSSVWIFIKHHTDDQLIRILEWAKKKDNLGTPIHPKGIARLLNK